MPRKPEYKPLLYTTTIRNPERFKDFMHILKRFNGRILNNKTVELFERELFKVGLYRPMKRPETVQDKWKSTKNGELASKPLTDEETKDVYQQNDPQVNKSIKGHKEAGFPKGWPSRFDTQFKLMKVLGFVYYEWGKPINFSQTGNYLADTVSIEIDSGAISREIVNPQNEQIAFMQAFAKQQRCNPFICELNDNIPLILLLEVIKKLNSDPDYNGSGISYKEIPLVIFWKDNDAESLYQRIKLLRKEHRYNPSNEVIEDICVNEILGGFKKFDLDSIVSEYPDEFVRKMRMTGLISFRGGGRFIDINHNEDDKINYILANYATYRKYTSKEEYFDYMSDIDGALFALKAVEIPKNVAADKLAKLVGDYSWDSIKKELTHLAKKTSSSHNILRFIAAPARLEFLTALAIKSKLPAVEVIPNYPCDDEGLPTSTAGGDIGDIECFEASNSILVEVTMSEGRQQTMMEVWPIARHLKELREKYECENFQCVFLAPSIFVDSENQIDWVKDKKQLVIRPYKIVDLTIWIQQHLYIRLYKVTKNNIRKL